MHTFRPVRAACAGLLLLGASSAAYAQSATKPAIHGLVTMGRLSFVTNPGQAPDNSLREANAHPGVYAGAVLLGTWAMLEPSPGQYDFSSIDAGLTALRAYNSRYPATPMVGKLRIFGGPNAPQWAKALDGGPLTLDHRDRSSTVGHFWSVPYRDAWRRLQGALAARYDGNPLIEEVAISSCASVSAEPFVVPLNRDNIPAMTAAGYSDAAMEACLSGAPNDYAAWTHVALDYTFNPWRTIAGGRPVPDQAFTIQVMDAFRQRFGARAVIANHGLTPQINRVAQSIIDEMHRLGQPIEFQTRSPQVDWNAVVQTGEQEGVSEMELWDTRDAGGPANIGADQLRKWRGELAR